MSVTFKSVKRQNTYVSINAPQNPVTFNRDLLDNRAVTAVEHGGRRVRSVGNTAGTADCVHKNGDDSRRSLRRVCFVT